MAIHARIDAEAFNRDTRLLVLDQTLVERQPARHALAGDGCGVRDLGWRKAAGRGAAPSGRSAGRVIYLKTDSVGATAPLVVGGPAP
jgi:hypothetical protein